MYFMSVICREAEQLSHLPYWLCNYRYARQMYYFQRKRCLCCS